MTPDSAIARPAGRLATSSPGREQMSPHLPSTRSGAVLLAALVAVPVTGPPALSAVVTTQSYPVPASRIYAFHGHGYGHGHGMSQYGALGAAKQGLGYRRILSFYYPGTSWGLVPSGAKGALRVLVAADTTPDLVVGPVAGLVVHDLGSGAAYRLPGIAGVTRWRLNVDGTRTVLGYFTTAWHRYLPGGRSRLVGDGQFSADRALTLWTPSGSRVYRGALRASSPTPGSVARHTVNVVSLDDYVRAVVPAEMPTSWSIEAVKAQAVAARTYAVWSRDQVPGRYWHICDTPSCQVYRGVAAEQPRGDGAVAATTRGILTSGGRAAFTQFSSSSGGWTTSGSRPYLVAKADPYDEEAANPFHDWSVRLSAARIELAYPGVGTLRRLFVTRRDGHGQWGGRVATIVLDGTRRSVTTSGDTFRSVFGLRSSWFAP
jgi:SpoIID/LytB domain protein